MIAISPLKSTKRKEKKLLLNRSNSIDVNFVVRLPNYACKFESESVKQALERIWIRHIRANPLDETHESVRFGDEGVDV